MAYQTHYPLCIKIPWVGLSIYHGRWSKYLGYGDQNTMNREVKIPLVEGSIYHIYGGQNILGRGFHILWVGGYLWYIDPLSMLF
jgi:hypothetical protein